MDVATIGVSALINAATTICLMIFLYSRWILPYLTKTTQLIPASVKDLVFPYVDSKFVEIDTRLTDSIMDLKSSVKATSARFQRTVNQAEKVLGDMDIDLDDEEQVELARANLAKRYGFDVAISAINQLLASRISKTDDSKKESDGWD